MLKNFWKTAASVTAALALVFTMVSPAAANTGGGSGGGGGGNVGGSVVSWKTAYSNTDSNHAWRVFVGDGHFYNDEGYITDLVNQSGDRAGTPGLADLCKRSHAIWWADFASGAGYGNWAFNYSGSTLNHPDDIRAAEWVFGGPPPVWQDRAVSYLHGTDWGNTSAPPVLICSAAIGLEQRNPEFGSEPENNSNTSSDAESVTHPYTYTTTVTRQITAAGGIDPIGKNNLENQAPAVVKTNFGKLYDDLGEGSNITSQELRDRVAAALDKDRTLERGQVTLSKNNQAGMAEGGVLNVTERRTMASINTAETITTEGSRRCDTRRDWNMDTQAYGNWYRTGNCTPWEYRESSTYKSSKKIGTVQTIGFWQMLAVHCNAPGFNAAVAASDGATVQNTGDASRSLAAVAYSKRYDSQPTVLDFGNKSNANDAKRATAYLSFYDKECGYQCITSADTKDGASKNNGATSNVGTEGNRQPGSSRYGAVMGGSNGNTFEAFRDNQVDVVTLDVAYPRSTGMVDYSGQTPVSTTVTRWAEGTPGIAPTDKNGGQFTMYAGKKASGKNELASGSKKLFTKSGKPVTQKNFSVDTYSGQNSTALSGFYRDFSVQSTWASEDGRPQVLNVKWEYSPQVATTIPGKVGFGSGGAVARSSFINPTAAVDGKCYAQFTNSPSDPLTDRIHQNTGSGTTNNLDTGLLNGESATSVNNLVVNFLRAVAE